MPQSTCSHSGCPKLVKARGVCAAHYYHLRIAEDGNRVRPTPTHCHCGNALVKTSMTGPAPTHCSKLCRSRAGAPAAAARVKARGDERRASGNWACKWDGCGAVLLRRTKWCEAHATEKRRLEPKDSRTRVCSEDDCNRPVRARGICSMHWRRWSRAEGRERNQPWTDRRRSNGQARRARMNGATETSAALLVDIVARDGVDCSGCGDAVDFGLLWPDPFSKSVDHVIPLSRGGSHSLENVQLMHLRCNISKGAKVA